MKKGYHSTQRKVFNSFPQSEFLGAALGYAIGMILNGMLQKNSSALEILGLVVGFAVGFLIDRMFYLEKDMAEDMEYTQPETIEAAKPVGDCTYGNK